MSGENTTVTATVTDTTDTKDMTAQKPGEEKKDKKKKTSAVLIGVLVGVVALVVIGVFIFRGLFAYRSVKVETCNGESKLERGGAEKEVFEGLKLVADDKVSTGADGEMMLLIDSDKHVVAAENTCFSVNAAGNKNSGKVTIDLEYGSTLITIDEKLNEGAEFEVETPNCTCSVRGTTFNVAYDPALHRTRVDVMDGVVRVKAGANEIDVNAGESVIVEDETIYMVSDDAGAEILTPLGGEPEAPAEGTEGSGKEIEGTEESEENAEPVLRVEETVVDGIVHHAYYEYDLDDRTDAWLDSVLSALDEGDNETVAMLCGMKGQNQDELAWVADQLTSGEIGEASRDSGTRRCYRLWKDEYKVGISLTYGDETTDIWTADLFFIPNDGSVGYAVDSEAWANNMGEGYIYSCTIWTSACESGMFNGEASAYCILRRDENEQYSEEETTCMVVNGLLDGELYSREAIYLQDGRVCYEERAAVYDNGICLSYEFKNSGCSWWEDWTDAYSKCIYTITGGYLIDDVREIHGGRDVYPY